MKYPFNKANKIKLVSVLKLSDSSTNKTESIVYRIPITNDSLIASNVKSIVTLDSSQINRLTDILYNYGIKGNKYTSSISTGVGLDGVIFFTNSKGKIVEYIEICFECGETNIKTSKTKQNIGIPCNQKVEMLRTFFIDTGIKF